MIEWEKTNLTKLEDYGYIEPNDIKGEDIETGVPSETIINKKAKTAGEAKVESEE